MYFAKCICCFISHVCCQIHSSKFFFLFCTMFTIVMKEYILIVVVDDLDLDFIDVVFEAKVFNRYSTFD